MVQDVSTRGELVTEVTQERRCAKPMRGCGVAPEVEVAHERNCSTTEGAGSDGARRLR